MEITVRDTDIIRFANKVLLPEGDDLNDTSYCWEWQGAKHGQGRGYGKFRLGGKVISAHKASYLLFVGPVAEGLVIGHQCNNEACVNPHHLKAETQSENLKYCVASGRHGSQRQRLSSEIMAEVGWMAPPSDFTLEDVAEIEF